MRALFAYMAIILAGSPLLFAPAPGQGLEEGLLSVCFIISRPGQGLTSVIRKFHNYSLKEVSKEVVCICDD